MREQRTSLGPIDDAKFRSLSLNALNFLAGNSSASATEETLLRIDTTLAFMGMAYSGNFINSKLNFLYNGVEQTVLDDTVTPGNNRPLPVKITSATGPINITAGDLNVQLTDVGVNYDSTRIGDGTTLVGVTTSNEMKVSDTSVNPTNRFAIARVDTSADPKYYGFLDKDGNWYIMRETTATGVFEYFYSTSVTPFTGASGWSNRALITYVECNSAF